MFGLVFFLGFVAELEKTRNLDFAPVTTLEEEKKKKNLTIGIDSKVTTLAHRFLRQRAQ